MYSDSNTIKLKTDSKQTSIKSINSWRLNNSLLNMNGSKRNKKTVKNAL